KVFSRLFRANKENIRMIIYPMGHRLKKFVVNPNNINNLAQAIRQVLTNDKLRDEMVRRGLEQAKKFSWEKAARQTLEVYNRVAGG
ncbi:unnamed protein product, partial [marine sediment metagenome]